MKKRIGSFVNINNNIGKLKFGTIDKKNPTVIYIEGGFYITPKEKKQSYKTEMNNISKQIKTSLNNIILSDNNLLPDNNFFVDVAEDRINTNKKTYFSFQIFLKPKLKENMNFQMVMDSMTDKEKWIKTIKNNLVLNDYIVTKTK